MGRKKGSKNKEKQIDENRKTETAIEERHNIETPIVENEAN